MACALGWSDGAIVTGNTSTDDLAMINARRRFEYRRIMAGAAL